jgi:hypothetical protein
MKRVITMLGAVLFGAVAAASPNQADAQEAVIYACVNNGSGTIRIVSPLAVCRGNDIPLTWNAVGVEGPEGPEGPAGPEGPPGATCDSAAARVFAGFDVIGADGETGAMRMNHFCTAIYGPGYLMCTSEEILASVLAHTPTISGPIAAWIRPTFVPGGDACDRHVGCRCRIGCQPELLGMDRLSWNRASGVF